MTALPPAREAKLDDLPNALNAYNICLALEKKVTTAEGRMYARILGYLILHAPSSAALSDVDMAIHSCAGNEEQLLELGQRLRLWFITPFKRFRGATPAPSYHPSRPSFDRLKEDLKKEIKEAPRNHTDAKAQALIRDNYKCVVTGIYDAVAEKDVTVHTELAHILPQSTHFDVGSGSTEKKDHAASFLAVLQRFGYDVEKVNGPKVHSLYNVMTMQKDAHDAFDRLELWFESTGAANCYRVRTTRGMPNIRNNSEITFMSSDPSRLPYPSSQLLALHAAAAKVAHLSGAGKYIDELGRDTDDIGVLATDGSSLAVLTHAIAKSTSRSVSIAA